MYQSHWGIRESPFRDCLDPQYFYQSPTHDEALARLHFLVEQHRRLGLLMGSSGSGKSLLLEVLARQLRRPGMLTARLSLAGMVANEMLWNLSAQLGRNLASDASINVLWRTLADQLSEARYQQIQTTLLLDDADLAGSACLTQLVRLTKLDLTPQSQLTIVLTGQRERLGRLGDVLLGQSELRIDLEPWDPADVARFVETSLAQAGRQEPLFSLSAIARLHELAGGIPRQVRQIADMALVAGAGRELEAIDADVVDSVYHEFAAVGD